MKRLLFLVLQVISFSQIYAVSCDSFLSCVTDVKHCNSTKDCFGNTFFSLRPQDSNGARRLLKIAQEYGHTQYNDPIIWGFDVSVGIQHSFSRKSNVLGSWFLFNGSSCITVGIPDDAQSFDVDGRQLGLLLTDTTSGSLGTLSLNPATQNIVADFSLWCDLNHLMKGFWVRLDFPIVRTKNSLNIVSDDASDLAESGLYDDGEYTIDCSQASLAYTSILEAFIGDNAIGVVPPLHFNKFYCGSISKTALASIRTDIGFDCIKTPTGFLNISACVVAPTGNRPKGRYLFEPIIGANKSWQVGGVVSGAYHFNSSLSLYGDITVSHLFKAAQTRVFSLTNGVGSQYLLLKEFDINVGATTGANRAANLLAGEAKIGANVMCDAALMLHYLQNHFYCDLGYNFWIRSHESIGKNVCLRNLTKNTYGIKGDTVLSEVDSDSSFCIGNLETESKSTIAEPGSIDSDTVFIDVCDINFVAALHPMVFSNKLFGAVGMRKDCSRLYTILHMGVQWELEFGQKNKAIDQWSVSFNIGSSF